MVALVLLMDTSASISQSEWQKQLDGTIQAFQHPNIQQTIENSDGIAVTTMLFGGNTYHSIPWKHLKNPQDINRFVSELNNIKQVIDFDTNIGNALIEANKLFSSTPCTPDKRIIDLSTDGVDTPYSVKPGSQWVQSQGVTINAIGIRINDDIEGFLNENVITHDGFVVIADDWNDFPRVMLRKLRMEIAQRAQNK